MTSPVRVVREQQRQWARSCDIHFDSDGYTRVLSDNLFAPLSVSAREEFAHGDGGELGKPGRRAKMQALHSSSALAYNFFDYWRGRDSQTLASALDLPAPIIDIAFEHKYPTGLPGNAPNLDVVIRPSAGPVVAIESKFLEPYGSHGTKSGFKPKYFESEPGLWQMVSYHHCQKLAEALYSGDHIYRRLHAEQLLKYILGLTRPEGSWALMYLWYEVPHEACDEHASEIQHFAGVADSDGIDFRALSYHALFCGVLEYATEDDKDYLRYMGSRYFGTSV